MFKCFFFSWHLAKYGITLEKIPASSFIRGYDFQKTLCWDWLSINSLRVDKLVKILALSTHFPVKLLQGIVCTVLIDMIYIYSDIFHVISHMIFKKNLCWDWLSIKSLSRDKLEEKLAPSTHCARRLLHVAVWTAATGMIYMYHFTWYICLFYCD